MSEASLFLEITRGGPLDGLPALSLRFEDADALLSNEPLAILNSMSPPPPALNVFWLDGVLDQREEILAFLMTAASLGMILSVETFSIIPWMLDRGISRRVLHTTSLEIPWPVEEVVFHVDDPPVFHPYPFHIARPPKLWWFPPSTDGVLERLPWNVALWTPRRRVEQLLFPKGE